MELINNPKQKADLYQKIAEAQSNLNRFEEQVVKAETEGNFKKYAYAISSIKGVDHWIQFDGGHGFYMDDQFREEMHIVVCNNYRRQMYEYINSLKKNLNDMIKVSI